jgi:hypothetical protein
VLPSVGAPGQPKRLADLGSGKTPHVSQEDDLPGELIHVAGGLEHGADGVKPLDLLRRVGTELAPEVARRAFVDCDGRASPASPALLEPAVVD